VFKGEKFFSKHYTLKVVIAPCLKASHHFNGTSRDSGGQELSAIDNAKPIDNQGNGN